MLRRGSQRLAGGDVVGFGKGGDFGDFDAVALAPIRQRQGALAAQPFLPPTLLLPTGTTPPTSIVVPAPEAHVDSGSHTRVRSAAIGEAMGRNKKLRIRIDSLALRITDHQIKIALERQRPTPNVSLIRHWAVEIRAWEQTIEQLTRRLKKGKRHD